MLVLMFNSVKLDLSTCKYKTGFCTELPGRLRELYGREKYKIAYSVKPTTCYYANMIACDIYNPCLIPDAYEKYAQYNPSVSKYQNYTTLLKNSTNKEAESIYIKLALQSECDNVLSEEYMYLEPIIRIENCPQITGKISSRRLLALALTLRDKVGKSILLQNQAVQILTETTDIQLMNKNIKQYLCPELCESRLKRDTVFPINDATMSEIIDVCSNETFSNIMGKDIHEIQQLTYQESYLRPKYLVDNGLINFSATCLASHMTTCIESMLVNISGSICITQASKALFPVNCQPFKYKILSFLEVEENMFNKVDDRHMICWQ